MPQTSGLAIASLVCGIASFVFCLGPLTGIAAVITGTKGRQEIDRSGGRQTGREMATAGLILGWVAIGITVAAIVIGVLFAVLGPSSSTALAAAGG